MGGKQGYSQGSFMLRPLFALVIPLCAASLSGAASAAPLTNPLRFFEGRTETAGTMSVVMHKPYHVTNVGRGTIRADGTLLLVQQVLAEGQPSKERVWRIHQIGAGKYLGTMTEAVGPVAIDEVGNRYRFRFTLKGGFSAEQWLTPSSDGNSGLSILTIRKFGLIVAKSISTIRRTSQLARVSP